LFLLYNFYYFQATHQQNQQQHSELSYKDALDSHQNTIEELHKKLNLLVCYPVMGEDYRTVEGEYTTALDEGRRYSENNESDVILDMERQLKANTSRIAILEKQNGSLRNTLMKLDVDSEERLVRL